MHTCSCSRLIVQLHEVLIMQNMCKMPVHVQNAAQIPMLITCTAFCCCELRVNTLDVYYKCQLSASGYSHLHDFTNMLVL